MTTRTRVRVAPWLAASITVTGVAALAGCGDPTPAVTRRGEVLVIGDSLTVGARDFGDLEELLEDDGWDPEIVAEEGVAPPWGLEQITERERVPPVVVVGLGSNPSPAIGDFQTEVDQILDALSSRGARIIVWIPPVTANGVNYLARAEILRSARVDHPALRVPNWDEFAVGRPDVFSEDELHLDEDGYRTLARYIADQLAA